MLLSRIALTEQNGLFVVIVSVAALERSRYTSEEQ